MNANQAAPGLTGAADPNPDPGKRTSATRCEECGAQVPHQPGQVSEALNGHYRREHPLTVRGQIKPDEQQAEPATLGGLLDQIMDQRGYRSLAELARHTAIPYQTLWAWKQHTRNLQRPPAVKILKRFAEDLNLPEATVFRAAGRAFPQPQQLGDNELEVLHLYQELGPADQALAETLLRNLAERVRDQKVTRG